MVSHDSQENPFAPFATLEEWVKEMSPFFQEHPPFEIRCAPGEPGFEEWFRMISDDQVGRSWTPPVGSASGDTNLARIGKLDFLDMLKAVEAVSQLKANKTKDLPKIKRSKSASASSSQNTNPSRLSEPSTTPKRAGRTVPFDQTSVQDPTKVYLESLNLRM